MSGTVQPQGVVFDYVLWAARYPELAGSVGSDLATLFFAEACLYLDNTPGSLVTDATPGGRRALILNMLTAHVAALNAPINGQASSALVGRIASATEGSVSVTADMGAVSPNAAWYLQTKYGAAAWTALAGKRTMRYFPGYGPYLGVSRAGGFDNNQPGYGGNSGWPM